MKNLILLSLVCSALGSSASCYLGIKANTMEPTCYGASTGSIQLSLLGGTAPYSYAWSGGLPNTALQTGLAAGTYSVTVTDGNDLTASYSMLLGQPFQILMNAVVTAPQSNGAADGSIETACDGGTPGYAYLWSTGATTPGLSGLTAGSYGLSVTDQSGCMITAIETLSQPAARVVRNFPKRGKDNEGSSSLNPAAANSATGITAALKDEDVQVYPNPAGSMLTLKTGDVNSAQITMMDLNGKVITELKSTSCQTNLNVAALANGNYIIEIKTDDGSVISKPVTVAR